MLPGDPIEKHFRLIPAQKAALKRLGIQTIHDLLYHFPARYEAAGMETNAHALVPGAKVTLFGTLSGLKAKKLWKSKRNITEGWFEDASGRVKVMWFNQPYMASYIKEGAVVRVSGTVGGSAEKPYIANPQVEKSSASEIPEGIFTTSDQKPVTSNQFPVYPESRGISSRWFYHALQRVFQSGIHTKMEDPIPETTRTRLNLPDLASALIWIHTPEKKTHAEAARKRFSFEEMFAIQAARAMERAENDSETAFSIEEPQSLAEKFLASLDYPPTSAQRRAIAEITADFVRQHPMARLLEGDVGSGKTLVAAATAYAVIASRKYFPRESASVPHSSASLQVAYMAPTEILAQQHFDSFISYFRHLPIAIALITGSGCKKFPSKTRTGRGPDADITNISRSQLLKWVANGEIAMIIGTHALIQKSVIFQNLAYAIVDEQHRFGVNQRKALVRGHTRNERRTDADDTPIDPLLYRDLTYRIREAVFKVRKELGTGHKEIVYQRALVEAFTTARLSFSRETQIPVMYQRKKVGTYVPDFVIEDKIIVELKALPYIGPKEKRQLWHYLKGSPYRVALLINFGNERATIDRVVYDTARVSASSPHLSASIPHFLSMTATPIPRTLALTIYGDLDISVLDELPPGRAKITTKIVAPDQREEAYEKIREELVRGRQAYVICPRIEQPQTDAEHTRTGADKSSASGPRPSALEVKAVKTETIRLARDIFPEFNVGMLHGGMTAKEKDSVMEQFANGKINVLVATSVVEVGINVPNATAIMIEGAERFGLAQLHQLRGRVQRSSHPPICFLLSESSSPIVMKRLRALEKSADGFALAETDLETRGPGDLYGRQQWGVSDLGMEALKNPRLIQAAREEAQKIVAQDPSLSNHPALAERVANASKELHGE